MADELHPREAGSRAPDRARLRAALANDLIAAHAYLQVNDAGVRDDPLSRAAAAGNALAAERIRLASIDDPSQGHAAFRRYLHAWRPGHLWVADPQVTVARRHAPQPTLAVLSPSTLLIRLPSFAPACAQPIVELLDVHRVTLESRPNWILDLRGGEGGCDFAYAPLLPWLMPEDWRCEGAEFLATPANADAHERLSREGGLPVEAIDALTRLAVSCRQAGEGSFVRLEEEREGFTIFRTATDGRRRPERVAILADAQVASSSEEFILTARSSPLVRVFGQATAGVLDYSNCRPWPLPSGIRTLWYATSRSLRLPQCPIDGFGISPDHPLPPPTNDQEKAAETAFVRTVLESEGPGHA